MSVDPPRTIDWEAIRRRIEAAARALEEHARPSSDETRRILEQRARALAAPVEPETRDDALELLTFSLGRDVYAVESRFVTAVFRLAELVPLPGAEPPVFGVTAWRGEILTLLDVRSLVGASTAALDDLARVVVLGGERAVLGVLANEVRDIVRLGPDELLPPAESRAEGAAMVRGVTRDAVLLFDAEALMESQTGSTPR